MINPMSNPSYLVPPLVALLFSSILAMVVWHWGRKTFSSRLFIGLVLIVGLGGLVLFGMRSSPDLHRALLWDRALPAVTCATFILYYHFTIAYTNEHGQRRILFASYLFLIFVIAISPTELGIKSMRLEDYGYAPNVGLAAYPTFLAYPLLIAGGTYNLLKRYRTSRSHDERNRLIYLTIGTIFLLLGPVLDAFSNLPPVAIWTNLIFCSIYSVAILKYHLLDIRIIIRKSLAYLATSVVVAVPYVSVLLLLNQILKTRIEPWWAHAFIILLLAILLRPLYSWAQHFVDRVFYRDRYDYLRALERFSGEAQSITNLDELGLKMVRLVSGALRTSRVGLLLPAESRNGFVTVSSTDLEALPSGVVLKNSSPLVKWLDLHGDILAAHQLDIIPQLQSLSIKERTNLEQISAKLIVPVKSREGQLSGILFLGEKLSHQSYSWEDLHLLTTVTNQIAIALENARLYQETKQSEEQLREREEEYRELAESITDIFFAMDEQLRYTYWNKASEEFTGVSSRETLGKHHHDIFPDIEATKRAERLYLKVLKTRQPQHFINEYSMKDKDFVFEITAYPSKDGLAVIARDITERKQSEEREKKLQQELTLSSRLASIGELAAGVAHEINNPLTGIMGFSQRLLRKSTDEKSKRDLGRIYDEANRAARVIENLRTFSRRREPNKELVNISDILQKALEMRLYELKSSNVEVATVLDPDLPSIMVDFHQTLQVFLNIIMNAEQALYGTNRGGELVIKTEKHEGNMIIAFTDNGPGIPEENLDKLFDPFFTTKGEKGGTGLGLRICHRIVTDHGGKIYVRSKLGKGTTFLVELPLGK